MLDAGAECRIKAQAKAFLLDAPVWFSPLPGEMHVPGLYLDVRINSDTRPQLPWGFCWRDPEDQPHSILVHPKIPGPKTEDTLTFMPNFHLAWELIVNAVEQYKLPIYCWGKAIIKHIRQTALPGQADKLLAATVDLSRVFSNTVAVPTGLQPVANDLGYCWEGAKAPYEAHISYLVGLQEARRELLQNATQYMEQNINAVVYIWHWLIAEQGE